MINIFHLFHLLIIVSFSPLLWFSLPPICPFPTHSSYCFVKKLHSLSITQLKLHNLHTLHRPSAHLPPKGCLSLVYLVCEDCWNYYLKNVLYEGSSWVTRTSHTEKRYIVQSQPLTGAAVDPNRKPVQERLTLTDSGALKEDVPYLSVWFLHPTRPVQCFLDVFYDQGFGTYNDIKRKMQLLSTWSWRFHASQWINYESLENTFCLIKRDKNVYFFGPRSRCWGKIN